MHPESFRAGLAGLALFALAPLAAQAAPVTLTLQGHVTGYDYIDLSAHLPAGAAVNLELSFNETFSDGSYDFGDDLGPVSGSMTVGAAAFTFDGYVPFSQQGGFSGLALDWVRPRFTGTGPAFGGGEFFGLFAGFTPDLTLEGELRLGYGFTTTYPDGLVVTNFGYARMAADSYSITPAATVPAPATLALAVTALLAAGGSRRRA